MDKKNVIIGSLSLLLIVSSGAAYYAVSQKNGRISELEKQISALNEKEKRNAVDREVSRQLEEIAYEQEQISDERRIEAERQSVIAKSMTKRAEEERIK
ncbi:MAG: hypothetical protein VZQ51_00635, partial [Bacteroidales bacterium]|nr:hypothetical protein [Bacteroidales bacterium]